MSKGNLPLLSPPPEDIHLWVGVNQAALPLQSTKKPGHAALESVAHDRRAVRWVASQNDAPICTIPR